MVDREINLDPAKRFLSRRWGCAFKSITDEEAVWFIKLFNDADKCLNEKELKELEKKIRP